MTEEQYEIIKNEFAAYLATVDSNNFSKKYDGFMDIVLKHKSVLGSRESAGLIICRFTNEIPLNEWQEEIIFEISNIIGQHCPPGKQIIW
jgi:hypothetical protein